MRRSKWPVQYRITYKLPQHIGWSNKYLMATTDEQAIDGFAEMFEHLREKNGKPTDPLPTVRRLEKFIAHRNKWLVVYYPR